MKEYSVYQLSFMMFGYSWDLLTTVQSTPPLLEIQTWSRRRNWMLRDRAQRGSRPHHSLHKVVSCFYQPESYYFWVFWRSNWDTNTLKHKKINSSRHGHPRLRTGHGRICSSYTPPQRGDPWQILLLQLHARLFLILAVQNLSKKQKLHPVF